MTDRYKDKTTVDNNRTDINFLKSEVDKVLPEFYSEEYPKLKTLFETQIIGSGFVVSLQYTSDRTDPPFSLDAITLEYATNTRR